MSIEKIFKTIYQIKIRLKKYKMEEISPSKKKKKICICTQNKIINLTLSISIKLICFLLGYVFDYAKHMQKYKNHIL